MSLATPTLRHRRAARMHAAASASLRRDPRTGPTHDATGGASRTPLLTAEQERTLAARIADGARDARDEMVRANSGLVATIARDYRGRGFDLEDLIAEGTIGLITAAERFDPRFGVRFSTYAGYWIKEAIRHALINTAATIRLPAHMAKLMNDWRRTIARLEVALSREPEFHEVVSALGLTEDRCNLVKHALLTRSCSGMGDRHVELTSPPAAASTRMEAAELREDLRRRLERLDPIERSVIVLRFGLNSGEPLTLKMAGLRLGFTREWVRKVELRALAKLAQSSP